MLQLSMSLRQSARPNWSTSVQAATQYNEVKAAMAEQGVACHTFNSDVLYEPWEVLSPSGQPLTSFADFWERWAPLPESAKGPAL